MKFYRKYFFCIALLMTVLQLPAQVQFSIAVDVKEIGRKDELQVDYVVSGIDKVSGFEPPYFDKWKVLSGPDFSTVSFNVNGKKNQVIKYSYVLSPSATGNIKLPGTTIVANNKKLSCTQVVINVKKQDHVDGVPPPGSSSMFQGGLTMQDSQGEDEFAKEYVLKPGEDPIKKIRNNLFIKAIASKSKVYVGEPVLITYRLYTRLKSHSRVVKQPGFTGCSVHEMTTNDVVPERVVVNGKTYNSYLFRKVQLVPLQVGKMDIGQASVENSVTFLTSSNDLRSLYYDEPAGDEHTVTLTSGPLSIEVLPLPKNVSAHAIGSYRISAKLKKDTSAANETNALIVTVEGAGNFKSLTEPEIKWPDNIYHFDATETDEIDNLSFPLAGRRVYEVPFEANATGKIDITPVTLSYFDPSKGIVQTVQSTPLHLTITPSVKTNLQKTIAAVEYPGFDIRLLFYIILIAFIIGAFIIWRRPRKQPQPAISTTENVEEVIVEKQVNAQEKLNALLLVQGDVQFYNKASDFAKEMIQAGKGNHDLLLQVLQDCNTMLYTPLPTTSKKEILDKLQQAIY
jgi:hypothetical protein